MKESATGLAEKSPSTRVSRLSLCPKPVTDHLASSFPETAFADVARRARSMHLGILAQVHSHPGADTRHSDGDDELVVMPFENMLSLVAPHYGRILTSIGDFSIPPIPRPSVGVV